MEGLEAGASVWGTGASDTPALEDALLAALQLVGAPGKFACGGTVESLPAFTPAVTVEGVGRLALPLCAEQAATLRAASQPAPYGKGQDTVLDEAVRRARQVPAACVAIAPLWQSALQRVVQQVVAELGVGAAASALRVEAQLDKLVLYEPGGFFLPHKDTEKAAGMFATLVVQLPCSGGHAGGELRVTHRGESFVADFAASSSSASCRLLRSLRTARTS